MVHHPLRATLYGEIKPSALTTRNSMAELFEKTAHVRDDPAYDKVVQGRRDFDAERRKRIFDPATREQGVDVAALDLQTAERRSREAAEFVERLDAEERELAVNRYLSQREREFHRMRLQREREDAAFNAKYVRPEYSREWDITNPAVLHVDAPIRTDSEAMADTGFSRATVDPRLGVSSGQVFDGEDLGAVEWEAAIRAEVRASLEQQIRDAKARQEAEKLQELEEQMKELQVCEHLSQVEKAFLAGRRNVERELMEQQMRQAAEDERRRAAEAEEDRQATLRHHENFGNSSLMLEKPTPGVAAEYKGWTEEQYKAHTEALAKQRADDLRRQRAELENKLLEEERELEVNRYLKLRDQELAREKQRVECELRKERERAAEDERAREVARLQAATNEITDDFYKYFQTTSR